MDNQKGNTSKKKCCDWKFFKLFFLQLFDIGKSTGSLIGEAINVFRIFQRSTASESFSLSFSLDYIKIMKWATNLIQIITIDLISSKKLSEFDLFIMYACIIPISLLFFTSSLVLGDWLLLYLFPYLAFLLLGVGIGFIGIDTAAAIGCSIAGGILIFFASQYISKSSLCGKMGCIKVSKEDGVKMIVNQFRSGGFQFSLAALPTVFIFTFHIILAFFETNGKFVLICSIIAFLILIIIFFFELFTKNCCCSKKTSQQYEKYNIKMIVFIINLFTIIIIPATENFISIIQDDYKNQWRLIVGYIALAVLLPLIMIFMLIRGNYPEICGKYKNPKGDGFNWYPYIELLDFIKQIAFAIVSSYDINYACIGIEVAWLIFIIALRPIDGISSYSLILGESLVLIITNSVAIYQKSHMNHTFSFTVTIIFAIICCLPAVASLYLYFIFDFDTGVNSKDEEEYDVESIGKTIWITIWLIPFAFVFVGLYYPIFF